MSSRAPRLLMLLAAVGLMVVSLPARGQQGEKVTVYKLSTCGCCTFWVDHMRDAGFDVEAHDVEDIGAVKTNHGVPLDLASCHTSLVNGYLVEGHVPADVVRRLLRERPDVAGIAVPGMPIGSPGMEQGDVRQPYDIISFDRQGRQAVYDSRR